MSSIADAIEKVCSEAAISIPRSYREGMWVRSDTFSGRNGRGDGSLKVDGEHVFAHNFQTGVTAKARIGAVDPAVRKQIAERRAKDDRERAEKARRAAWQASQLMLKARSGTHPYLARKGFAQERALVAPADLIRDLGIPVVEGGKRALVVPARIGDRITSAQIIWEDGSKRYLFGGDMGGACHRVRSGPSTWLCEGFATALSLRAALQALKRTDGVLVCFHASNLPIVARKLSGKVFVAADNDGHKPQEHFDGLGTGEHYARQTGKPYAMPPEHGMDVNDMHMGLGIFAVQKMLMDTIRRANVSA